MLEVLVEDTRASDPCLTGLEESEIEKEILKDRDSLNKVPNI